MDKSDTFVDDKLKENQEPVEDEEEMESESVPETQPGLDAFIYEKYQNMKSPFLATKAFREDILSTWPKTTFPSSPTGEQLAQIGALKLMACDPRPNWEEARGFAQKQFLDRLDRFKFEQLRHAAPTYFDRITGGDTHLKDEVRSACDYQILKNLPRYDYLTGVPITFFKPYLRSGLRAVTNADGFGMPTPSHYAEKNKIVLKAIQKLEAQGMVADVENIRDITGESRQVITDALERLNGGKIASLDNEEMKEVADNKIPNPAEALMKKETDALLRKMRHDAKLTPLETLIACILRDRAEKGKVEKTQEIVDAVNRHLEKKGSSVRINADKYTVLRSTMVTKMTEAARTGNYGDEIKSKYGRSRTPSNICLNIADDDGMDQEMDSIVSIDLDTGVKAVEHGQISEKQAQSISIFLAEPMPEEGKTVASIYTRSQGRSMNVEIAGEIR